MPSDLDVLKDIPGYKAIMKSVLKSQIQLLLEQLSEKTGEESIILTASITDGTLSHLGSNTGRGFLEGRDEVKSQFLGYCLKSHHGQKLQPSSEESEQLSGHGPQPYKSHIPPKPLRPYPYDRPPGNNSVGNRYLNRPSKKIQILSPPVPNRFPEPSQERVTVSNLSTSVVKGEPGVDSGEIGGATFEEHSAPDAQLHDSRDDSGSGPQDMAGDDDGGTDSNQGEYTQVKLEPISQEEIELEITGVEPGSVSLDSLGMSGYGSEHTGDSEMLCQECGKAFKHRSSFRRHIRSHAGVGLFRCCGKVFQDADHLRRHKAAHHDGPKNHVCSTCGRSFATGHQLLAHKKSEKRGDRVVCQVCGKDFPSEKLLNQHAATHADGKPYRCSCGKAYKHNTSLSKHKQTHT